MARGLRGSGGRGGGPERLLHGDGGGSPDQRQRHRIGVGLADRAGEVAVGGDNELGVVTQRPAEVLEHELVRRISDRDDEPAVLHAKRKHALEPGLLLG